MNVFIEFIATLLLFLFYLLEALVKTLLPFLVRKKSLHGHNVLVTGAGSGLGRLMSIQFAKRGCNLILWDINLESIEETAEDVKKFGVSAYTYQIDLSKREEVNRTASHVKRDVGDIDILVNNAGIVTGKKLLECPDALIQKTMDVNVGAHFWTVKAFLPAMLEKNHGHLVSIASNAGLFGVTGLADYCASKFAAVGFDESMRNEIAYLGKTGVKTTVVCPTFINTGMFEGIQSRFLSILPLLDQDYVVSRIMYAIETNQEVLLIPRIVYVLLFLKGLLPVKAGAVLSKFTKIDATMDTFIGRQKQK